MIASNTWVSPSLRGDGPEAREGHSAALIGKRLFIFGGCAKVENSEIYYDDLYILNIGMCFLSTSYTERHSFLLLSLCNFGIIYCYTFSYYPQRRSHGNVLYPLVHLQVSESVIPAHHGKKKLLS